MFASTIVALALPLVGILAAPAPQSIPCPHSPMPYFATSTPSDLTWSMSMTSYNSSSSHSVNDSNNSSPSDDILTIMINATLTVTKSYTQTATENDPTSTSSSELTAPMAPFGVISARNASPIHLLPMQARGQRIYLGGEPATYCPDSVNSTGVCPPGNITAFASTCSLSTLVPGGQAIYVTLEGQLGYTQAHSASIPPGANACSLAYTRNLTSQAVQGYLSTTAFNSTGFMACPTLENAWQVYANIQNATVPKGNLSECLGFKALTYDFVSDVPAAWQYT